MSIVQDAVGTKKKKKVEVGSGMPDSTLASPREDAILDPLAQEEQQDDLVDPMVAAATDTAQQVAPLSPPPPPPEPKYLIKGANNPLMGMLFTDGMQQLGGQWFDNSAAFLAFQDQERQLAQQGLLDAEGAASTATYEDNRQQIAADASVTVNFLQSGDQITVEIGAGDQAQSLSFDLSQAQDMEQMKAMVQQILAAMRT